MKFKQALTILFSGLFLSQASYAGTTQPTFYDTQGHSIHLSDFKGKWIVLNYWAGWCGACVQEIPELNHFYQTIKGKNIMFYGIDYDDLTADGLKSEVNSVNIQYPVLTSDPAFLWSLDSVDVIPTTFIINPLGHVVKVITGPNTEKSLMNELVSLGF